MGSIRRWGLALGTVGVVALAGCSGSGGDAKAPVKTTGAPTSQGTGQSKGKGTGATGGATTPGTPGGTPDLKEPSRPGGNPGGAPPSAPLNGGGKTLSHYTAKTT